MEKKPRKSKLKAKDTPITEITLRKYEKPYKMNKRELVKKLCLSIGLLQPGDSRDIIVDILFVLITYKSGLTFKELEDHIFEFREKSNLSVLGATPSNIHRQLKRLKDMYLIEKHLNIYRLTEGMSLIEIFEQKILKFHFETIKDRVKDYFIELS
jgi:DNA-binding transcriptional ArsR family regulator